MSGKQLRKLRIHLGHTQATLAVILGTTRNTVFRWEAGTHPIPGPVRYAMRCGDMIQRSDLARQSKKVGSKKVRKHATT